MTRLRDMGLEDYLMTATLKAVLAQRLVRRLCSECKVAEAAQGALIERFEMTRLAPAKAIALYHPMGCPACRGTGFRGRRAIAELLVPTRAIDRLIFEGADDAAIERAAVSAGATGSKRGLGFAANAAHDLLNRGVALEHSEQTAVKDRAHTIGRCLINLTARLITILRLLCQFFPLDNSRLISGIGGKFMNITSETWCFG
jgi:hypothetical protein